MTCCGITMRIKEIRSNVYNGNLALTYFWLSSKQQFLHSSLPHPGPGSSRSSPPSFLQARSSRSINFRLLPEIELEARVEHNGSKIILVFGELSDNTERRGKLPAGDGDGVGDHVRCGVDG